MKTAKLFLMICIFFVLIGSVTATRYVEYEYYEGVIASNGEVIHTSTQVTNANALGFVCEDDDCSRIDGVLWNGDVQNTGNDNEQFLVYPTTRQNDDGYGVYHYKPGYITWEANPTWWGTKDGEDYDNPAGPYNIYLSKKEGCYAPIDTFTIENQVQPNVPLVIDIEASLDATTYAALRHRGPLAYVPPALAEDYYSVETRVTLTITKANNQVYRETRVIIIPYSGSARVHFEWTPEEEGDYKAEVETYVTDAKCSSSIEQEVQSRFTVIEEDPRNMCYTLLNDLAISNQFPTAGETVTLTAKKISNHADDIYRLTPVMTKVSLSIVNRDSSTVVHTEDKLYDSNWNAQDYAGVSFDWTIPNIAGNYDITMHAIAEDGLCTSRIPNLDETETLGIYVVTKPHDAPVLEGIPDQTLDENEAPPGQWIDLWQYASDDETSDNDLQFTRVSQSNANLISCHIDNDRYIDCTTPAYNTYGYSDITIEVTDGEFWDRDTFRVTVNRVNDYPIISNIPNVRMKVGDSVSLDLDHYTHDPDNTNDELTWSWTGDNNIEVDFDATKHIVTFTGPRRWYGEERLTFTVTDPDGLSDSDICIVYVVVPEPKNDDILIARIRNTDYLLPGNMLMMNIALESNTYLDLEDLQITAVIQALGIKGATRHFELEGREETAKTIYMEIPEWAAPGYYDIRLTISNNELRRVVHRDIKII